MADAWIVRRGGGGNAQSIGGGYAVIGAEYPAGSSCTCAKGSTTLRAKGSTGAAAFNIPEAGTWTVSCTDGTHSVSTTVNITAEGQVRTVKLGYELVLLENGVLADGHTISGSAELNGGIQETDNGGFYLTGPIDVTGYSTLSITGTLTYVGASGYTSTVGFSKTPSAMLSTADLHCVAQWTAQNYNTTISKSVDITGLGGGEWYLCSAHVGNRLKLTTLKLQ